MLFHVITEKTIKYASTLCCENFALVTAKAS